MKNEKIKLLLGTALLIAGIAGVLIFSRTTHAPSLKTAAPLSSVQVSKAEPPQSTQTQAFNKEQYSLSEPSSIWVVVNKTRPLSPINFAPTDLISVGKSEKMRTQAALALQKLQAAALQEGLTITALSGYRSYQTQSGVYANEVKNYGQGQADRESARPGTSEHQTGLAVDVGGGGCGIEDCFGTTAEGKWLALHAYEYGFLIRYAPAKESITGYRAEPWHIRYIGTVLSSEMNKQGVTTLEEFFGLPAAPTYP